MTRQVSKLSVVGLAAGALAAVAFTAPAMAQAWQPTKAVTFVIPAGTGGGADQMARFIQGVVTKHSLMNQPMVVINKAGGAGAEGFLDMKASPRDPHKIIITLSNLFTTPMATGSPFSWKDLTPVAMLALDQFVLWVNAETPYKTAADYINAVKGGNDRQFKMGGTGSKQEDQIITVALERLTGGKKFTYVPFAGGGAVAVQLVGKHVDGHDGVVRHPDLQGIGRQCRLPDAPRRVHDPGRDGGAGQLLRRAVQEGHGYAGLEGLHGEGRFQSDLHDR
jgi:putative tricarboxylic transport membrane protein